MQVCHYDTERIETENRNPARCSHPSTLVQNLQLLVELVLQGSTQETDYVHTRLTCVTGFLKEVKELCLPSHLDVLIGRIVSDLNFLTTSASLKSQSLQQNLIIKLEL